MLISDGVQVQQGLVHALLKGQRSLHGLQASSPLIALRFLKKLTNVFLLDPLDYWLSRTFFQKQKPFLWCIVNEPWCPGGRCDHHGCSGASLASRHVHAPRRTTPWRTLKILSELRHHDRSKTPEIFTNMINIQCIVMFLLNLTCFSHVIQTSCII